MNAPADRTDASTPGRRAARTSAAGGLASGSPLLGAGPEPTLLELSVPGRRAFQLPTTQVPEAPLDQLLPASVLRADPPALPEVSERDLVAHVSRLAHRQYAVDVGAYPLGSCTMKYNPKAFDALAAWPELTGVHPAAPAALVQGWLALLVELEEALCQLTGMAGATLQPAAGAAGELTGLLLVRAWHRDRGERRSQVLIPDSAHGTNPASVRLAGFEAITVPTAPDGGVDLAALEQAVGPQTAAIMLTNPNTLGLFEQRIEEMAEIVHRAGGLLYYDGANLNAIVGVVRPGDMGFDIVHLNLHKTFATPHGGGGPGAGPVAVGPSLLPYLPGPKPARVGPDRFEWSTPPRSIGRVHSWHGNALVLARALAYLRVHGADGLRRVAELAVLNARWLQQRLQGCFEAPYDQPCLHEFVVSAAGLRRTHGVRAIDVAKGLLDHGVHAPTVAFPLIVEDALMFEPTETESLATLEALAEACEAIVADLEEPGGPERLRAAPRRTPVSRVDEARAARRLVPVEGPPIPSRPG